MDQAQSGSDQEQEGSDCNAILMMLAYVEAECRRLGSEAAARHAALAAAFVQGRKLDSAGCLGLEKGLRLQPLH